MFARLAPALALAAAALALAPVALASGGPYVFAGGTPAERSQVTQALQASSFPWDVVRQTVVVHIGRGVVSDATPGSLWLDADLLDSEQAMTTFLNLIATEPEVARLPIMVDSSRWSVLEAGLKCLQGKGVVNSLSLKEGEEAFLEQARRIRRYGAGVVVMAFDEEGQAETVERRVAICERAYRLLVERAGFPPGDVVLDANVLAVATGIEEHNAFARAFIEAVPLIKERCPGAKTSGGISNLSFAFRGNDVVREAMHAAFLYHAIRAGLDMGIVNAGLLMVYEDIEPELLERVEDVIFNRRDDATERLVEYAERGRGEGTKRERDLSWREAPAQERLSHALVHGTVAYTHLTLPTSDAV